MTSDSDSNDEAARWPNFGYEAGTGPTYPIGLENLDGASLIDEGSELAATEAKGHAETSRVFGDPLLGGLVNQPSTQVRNESLGREAEASRDELRRHDDCCCIVTLDDSA